MAVVETTSQVLRVQVGNGRYALPLDIVREVVEPSAIFTVPLAPDVLVGLAHHRGRVVPIYSLARMLGHPPADDEGMTTVICAGKGQPLGFAVGGIEEVSSAQDHAAPISLVDVFGLLEQHRPEFKQGNPS